MSSVHLLCLASSSIFSSCGRLEGSCALVPKWSVCCWPLVNCLLQVDILRCRAGQALEPECSRTVRPLVVGRERRGRSPAPGRAAFFRTTFALT